MAKVSIIVPIYNVEKYVKKCFDSLINQTFKDIEIWAISDGSPDNSIEIAKKYAKKDKRFICIEKENGGYGSVLEYVIKNIKTEYFLICDPDDWLAENAIEVLYNKAQKNKLDIVCGSFNLVFSDNKDVKYYSGIIYSNVFVPKANQVYTNDLYKFLFLAPSPHAKLFKTSIAKGIKFPYKVSFTDFLLYSLYVMKAKRGMYLEDPLAYYLVDREGNSVTDINPKIADYYYTVFNSIYEQYDKFKEKKDCFYFRLFLYFVYANVEITKIKDYNIYLEKRKLLYENLKKCVEKRKQIYNEFRFLNFRKKFAYKLYLMPLTSKFIFNFHSTIMYKKNNKQVVK